MLSYSNTLELLHNYSYRRAVEVLNSGDYRVLGDSIEVWPVNANYIQRLSFLGEDLESVQIFQNQKWLSIQNEIEINPNYVTTQHGKVRPEEYLVHPSHGVGRFEFIITKQNIDLEIKTYISIEYAGNDRILFPIERESELMPYIGSKHPRLTRLYSKSWQNTKERIAKDLIKIAREILKIYAARQLSKRVPYPKNELWLKNLAKTVEYQLTDDQRIALLEIENDLCHNDYPMDRLLCGDVGFGKTEVALRAAIQVLASGRQVAFLAPTTVLVEQHYALMETRLAKFPLNIAHLSRLTREVDKNNLKQLKEGKVDLVVGTHRLLGKDIEFKDLGLLIVDEEQKFGVSQKDRLKQLRPQVDVLSLSATPIPRTLSMSLSGLRGLSTLRNAPHGRKPIKTTIEHFKKESLKSALIKELKRNGQIYVVHNRVQSLPAVTEFVRQTLQETEFAGVEIQMAHGKLPEQEMAKKLSLFLKGEYPILVASSIVEHGLDSPGANTLIVLHSEWFGLSDLYQLRGRVGRRQKQAFAHFMIGGIERQIYLEGSEDQTLISENAKKRLQVLKDTEELGSGWTIALKDLEIRGGGNILGHEQSGNMEAIGILLYSQLLQETIGKEALRLGIPILNKNIDPRGLDEL